MSGFLERPRARWVRHAFASWLAVSVPAAGWAAVEGQSVGPSAAVEVRAQPSSAHQPTDGPPADEVLLRAAAADASAPASASAPADASGSSVESAPADASGSSVESASADEIAHSRSGADPSLQQVEQIVGPHGLVFWSQLLERAPTVTVCSAFDAGTVHDSPDAPGVHRVLARMLESGGYRSQDGHYGRLVEERGGRNEALVSADHVSFCTTLPSPELGLALWVAGSRFSGQALTEGRLRETVAALALEAEERDSHVLSGRAPDRLRRMALLGSPKWGRPALATSDQLDAVTLEQVRAAHDEAYVAARARIAIVGGGRRIEVEQALSEYFEAVRPGERSAASVELLPQHTTRFSMAEDRSAAHPAVWYAWVAQGESQRSALNAALSLLLSDSRLGSRLLGGTRPATGFELVLAEPTPGPAVATLHVQGRGSRSLGIIESELERQIRNLAQAGPTAAEWQELLEQRRARLTQALITSHDRAEQLSRLTLFGASPRELLAPLDQEFVPELPSTAQIKQAAAELLATERRSMVEVYPKGWQDPWQVPMPLYHIVESGQTLGAIARRYGTSVAVIEKMNGISRSHSIYPGDKLKVPRGLVKKPRAPRTHQVHRGDTLSGLAVKYGVSIRDIANANGMGSKQTIRTGETLNIPWPSSETKAESTQSSSASDAAATQSTQGQGTHIVQSGETLSGIALRAGVSTSALARANGLSHDAMVRVGQKLTLPPRGTGKPQAAVETIYVVQKGDTLSGIAKKHGVTVAALTVANRMSRKSTIRPGQKLKIPASQ